jgi:hypothetical protein
MTRGIVNNWIPWYVDERSNKVACRILGIHSQRRIVECLANLDIFVAMVKETSMSNSARI